MDAKAVAHQHRHFALVFWRHGACDKCAFYAFARRTSVSRRFRRFSAASRQLQADGAKRLHHRDSRPTHLPPADVRLAFFERPHSNFFSSVWAADGRLKTWARLTDRNATAAANLSESPLGCDVDKLAWCSTTPAIAPWLYNSAYALLLGAAFTALNIQQNVLFSRILGPRRNVGHFPPDEQPTTRSAFQAAAFGGLQATASGARVVGPILISALFTFSGVRAVWLVEILVLSTLLGFWTLFYRRMVPLRLVSTTRPTYANHEHELTGSNSGDNVQQSKR